MVKKNKLTLSFFITFILICCKVGAQDLESYNRIYNKTYLETSQKDFNKALIIADSLFQISLSPKLQAKSLMLSATLNQQSGNIKKAVEYALKAEEIVSESEELLWQSKIYGFLSSQYRHLGLFSQSKDYIDKSERIIKKLDNPSYAYNMMGFVMQEKAYYEIERKNYKKALNLISKSQNHFNLAGNKEIFLTANNKQLEGLCFLKLNDFGKAFDHYKSAEDMIISMPDNFLKGLIFSGIAQVYIESGKFVKAKEYLDKAELIARQSKFLSLKNEINKTWQQYYLATKNIDKLTEATLKHDSTTKKISDSTASFINKEYTDLQRKNTIAEKKSLDKSSIIAVFAALFLSIAVASAIFYKKNKTALITIKKDLDKTKNSYAELQFNTSNNENKKIDHDVILKEDMAFQDKNLTTDDGLNSMMTIATEQKLLAKLEKFENSILFTKNTISLSYLAAYCDTNTKYLSYIINNYKHKDFNNYINELRINYIIEKVRTDPKYQKYKVASLADEAGFSSQSKFAIAFKKITDISPSHFLQTLRNDET